MRRLRTAHGRRHGDLLLLEGPHLAVAAAEAGLAIRHLLVTPGFRVKHDEVVRQIEDRSGTPGTPIDPERLREQADADAPQGIVALAEPPPGWNSADGALKNALFLAPGLHLYVDGVQDPGNLGAMARSAEAAGAVSLLLGKGAARPGQPRALRASAGSLLRLPVSTAVRVYAIPSEARWLALTPHSGESRNLVPTARLFATGASDSKLAEVISADAVVLAVGNESRGLSTPAIERADMLLSIAISPAVESLNATVAASLALFELGRLRAK